MGFPLLLLRNFITITHLLVRFNSNNDSLIEQLFIKSSMYEGTDVLIGTLFQERTFFFFLIFLTISFAKIFFLATLNDRQTSCLFLNLYNYKIKIAA